MHPVAEGDASIGQSRPRTDLLLGERIDDERMIDRLPRRIDGACATLRHFPIALEGAAGEILRVIDLTMAVQARKRITAKLTRDDDGLARPGRIGIVDHDRRHLGVDRRRTCPAVMNECAGDARALPFIVLHAGDVRFGI